MAVNSNILQAETRLAPGDVLLLNSANKGVWNIAGQSFVRGTKARYTHVAIVINENQIVDAIPNVGVGFRRWDDVAPTYDIKSSRVARNLAIFSDVENYEKILRHATYFFKQPYRLKRVMIGPKRIQDQTGMVCSHFVAAMMKRFGILVSRRSVTATLPVDIDFYTRHSPEWENFDLEELYFPPGLDQEQAWVGPDGERIGQYSFKGAAAIRNDVDSALRLALEEQYNLSLAINNLDKQLVCMTEAMQNWSSSSVPLFSVIEPTHDPAGLRTHLTGASFFNQWEALHVSDAHGPVFLHDEMRGLRLERQCAALEKLVCDARDSVNSQIVSFAGMHSALREKLSTAAVSPKDDSVLVQAKASLQDFRKKSWLLYCESHDNVLRRVGTSSERRSEMIEIIATSRFNDPQRAMAVRIFDEICSYDVDVNNWHCFIEPNLKILEEALGE